MQLDVVLWLDNQLPSILAKWIQTELNIKAHSTFFLGLQTAIDRQIFLAAKAEGNVVILTKDGDFTKLLILYEQPPKIIKLEIGNMPNRKLWDYLKPLLNQALELLSEKEIDIVYLD